MNMTLHFRKLRVRFCFRKKRMAEQPLSYLIANIDNGLNDDMK